ncbi:ATP-dependent DNA helicase PIF1 [Colletotrichum gloeosporioides Cg-14]|uniref:ATP-dependent DNA helicase n=1 Tax=Colletotrichum gloeosporioides (strain Cg-14) TaxID=1237896 RepID=T0LDK9_COLGC|nr:ATP-dependent DNA helicase PIF1 [Colletotrichum gloeosporioides Cg-14]
MGKWLDELRAANPPVWALEEAENFIEKNRHRVNLDALADPAKAKKYYVVYLLRGPKADGKQYGIFSNHSECQKQLTGCNNRNVSVKTREEAVVILKKGLAAEFTEGCLPRSLTNPRSTTGEISADSGDDITDENAPRKRVRLHEPSKLPGSSHEPSFMSEITEPQDQENSHEQECEDSSDKVVKEETSDEQGFDPSVPKLLLSLEQQRALDLAIEGHNLFITGSGGCGKSYLVETLNNEFRTRGKNVYLLAPTGQAAVNIGGRTTFSYMNWRPEDLAKTDQTLVERARGQLVWKRITSTDVLIIDEISMVGKQFFERLSYVIRMIRQTLRPQPANVDSPFGGIQIIVVGDFCQLAPIKGLGYCRAEIQYDDQGRAWHPCGLLQSTNDRRNWYCPENDGHPRFADSEKWAFKSEDWLQCNFSHINLTTIHRQKDAGFVRILQNIRMGHIDDRDLAVLLQTRRTGDGIRLFSHNFDAEDYNDGRFATLPGDTEKYGCVDHPASDGEYSDLHRYTDSLSMKVGMPVVLQANVDVEEGLCNGSRGKVIRFVSSTESEPMKPNKRNYRGDHLGYDIACARYTQIRNFRKKLRGKPYPEVLFSNGQRRVIGPDCSILNIERYAESSGDEKKLIYSSRTQIPLVPGWAMTIHKSQSLTLDPVSIDLSRAWDGRLKYVALSRARSLQGLQVRACKSDFRNKLELDPEVKSFMVRVENCSQEGNV